jgi:hypothetical protein
MALGLMGILTVSNLNLLLLLFLVFLVFCVSPLSSPLKLRGDTVRRGDILLMLILFIQAMVNLIGALGPELGFDALWYHTTIPKLWLAQNKITFLGGDYYYSGLPKLVDMLYTMGGGQLLHFSFGILCLVVIYKLSRKYLNKTYSLLACVIFYSNLVVGWQSITAYIDLGRTFFEILALYLFIEKKYFQTSVVLGLAVASKILAIGSLPIFVVLGLPISYLLTPIFIVSPWLIFNFLNTGNPIYPISSGYPMDWNFSFNILRLADPINPIYVMVLVELFANSSWFIEMFEKYKLLFIYCVLSFVVWFLTPHTGGGRFLLPYLPAWSVLAAILIHKNKFFVGMAIVLAVVSIGYRGLANAKYLPYLMGMQTKQEFLDKYLYYRFK